MKIKKAVIIAAGFGTRFLPVTKVQAKELMPIVDKPVLEYIVEEMINSGITNIILVVNKYKISIENHFDRLFELEHTLKRGGKEKLLEKITTIPSKVNIAYVRQQAPLGTAHALLCAKAFVGNEPFVFSDADSVIDSKIPATKQLLEIYNKYKCPIVGVQKTENRFLTRYGNIYGKKIGKRIYKVEDSIEKPDIKKGEKVSPQGLFIAGMRYILTPQIFPILEKLKPGKGGEYYINDGIKDLLEKGDVYAYHYEGDYYDTGNKLEYLKANVNFAFKHEEVKDEFKKYLKNLEI
ncbi:MAG: UTP--glucose-1-phosphate uridylyltransferase [Patescibacteria group bacterium]|nr:UTP--glucose-1-phosphate uridylyltransferase [Patescibacteria group bacterium]